MGSVRRHGDYVRVSLEQAEAVVLVQLTSQTHEMLADAADLDAAEDASDADSLLDELVGMSLDAVAPPDDPALRRLLPDAYPGDEEATGEFRRLTDKDLRAAKRADLSKIDVPMLVIQGDDDRVLPYLKTGKRLPGMIKDMQMVTIDGGPHAIAWTHADQVNAALLKFMA